MEQQEKAIRDTQNHLILYYLTRAKTVAQRLADQGHTIERIEMNGGRPVIWIQNTERCHELDGAWYRREIGTHGQHYTHQAIIDGCRVQWVSDYLATA